MIRESHEVTELLAAWASGEQSAFDRLMPLVYGELHRMARRYMRQQRSGHTLQATALINEAYLRLINQKQTPWRNRAHFFGVAAQAMRHILVDYARARQTAKRKDSQGEGWLDVPATVSREPAAQLIALDDALESLSAVDPRKGRLVVLRYFGGLSVEETAEVLKVSPETVTRDWRLAKTWLLRELSRSVASDQ